MSGSPRRVVKVLCLLLILVTGVARADTIWSGLILATNEERPKQPPAEISRFEAKLQNIFGYNQFELLGQHTEVIDLNDEKWLIPGKTFCLRTTCEKIGKSWCQLRMELFKEQKLLVNFEARLGPRSPLFIRGPLCGKGQLIIVLVVE